MLYRNRKTGVTVDVVSELSGVWEPVKAPASRKPTKPEAPEKTGKKPSAKQKDDVK